MVSSVKYNIRNTEAIETLDNYSDLVHKLTHKYMLDGLDYSELFTVGQEALINAHNTYDGNKGASFFTYAYAKIEGAVAYYAGNHVRHTKHKAPIEDWYEELADEDRSTNIDNDIDVQRVLSRLEISKFGKVRNGNSIDGKRSADILKKYWLLEQDHSTIAKDYNISAERVRQILNRTMRYLNKEYANG